MKPLTLPEQALVETSLEQTQRIAKRLASIFRGDADSIESSALSGVIHAAQTFQPSLGSTWHRWSNLHINKAVLMMLRKQRRAEHRLRNLKQEAELFFDGRHLEEHEEFAHRIRILPKIQREVIRLVYECDLTINEASKLIGMSRFITKRLHDRAIATLRLRAQAA